MKKHIAIFPGSFDPIHKGHLNIIKRASQLFDYLYVAVSHNVDKATLHNLQERFTKTKQVVAKLKLTNVEVIANPGMTTNLMKRLKCQYLVRSIRNLKDCEYELGLAQNYRLLNSKIETVLFVADSKLNDISSTNRKEIMRQQQLIKRKNQK